MTDCTGNSHSWISKVPGKGSITLSWPEAVMIDRVVWGRDREEAYRDRLATEYYLEAALEPGRWQVVASSLDRVPYDPQGNQAVDCRSESIECRGEPASTRASPVRQRTAASARRARLDNEGLCRNVQPARARAICCFAATRRRKGREFHPRESRRIKPSLALDPQSPEAARRAALARWIADPANPLPARVMVNRLWHYHFGRGIVATPSDFGFNGAPPSHPELLDWLAAAYIEGGWRLKPIHRLIVTSAAYRQSSRLDAKGQAVDRDNRLLWRMTPRRLEAESIRDAILSSSGKLDPRMGGPGYNVWEKNDELRRDLQAAWPSSRATRFAGWSISSSPAASATRHSARSTARTPRWPYRGATSRRPRFRP